MSKKSSIIIGKFVRHVARLRSGGSALPGLVIEKIDKNFVYDSLSQLPHGVVVISGTNGKTTTTKIVVELLESQGLKVFTNRTGSNFVRGIIAAILENINISGKLDADIAVLELDEAHAVKFVELVPPKYSLLLNVMRDQLDRFGEIDHTARLLHQVASATTGTVISNREDKRLTNIKTNATTKYFGLSAALEAKFPEDDDLLSRKKPSTTPKPAAIVTLTDLTKNQATFSFDDTVYATDLLLKGVYNALNSAAALALVKTILPQSDFQQLVSQLSHIQSAFGRGETFDINGAPLELFLVKNPSGFQLALESFAPAGHSTMIAINDNYADGRDMSWLWNVDFSSLQKVDQVSGVRAHDMALRLKYDEIEVSDVNEEIIKSLSQFIQNSDRPKRIFATYTAMLSIRKELANYTKVKRVL